MAHGTGLRFRAMDGSLSGHDCCFTATVVDVAANQPVAECPSLQIAEAVADAMNRYSAELRYGGEGNPTDPLTLPFPKLTQ